MLDSYAGNTSFGLLGSFGLCLVRGRKDSVTHCNTFYLFVVIIVQLWSN